MQFIALKISIQRDFKVPDVTGSCPVWVQSRRFDRTPMTSALPLQTDIVTVRRHVSKVPIPAVASNGVVHLPRVTFLDTLRLVAIPTSLV